MYLVKLFEICKSWNGRFQDFLEVATLNKAWKECKMIYGNIISLFTYDKYFV